jgi:tetratricopeptide (TPR) repeat protein
MIYAFKRGRIGFSVVMGISILLSVLIWFRDQNYPVYVPIIASTLMLALGYVSARLMGNVMASSENTRYLGYLHMELDPKKFLSFYEGIPSRVKGENTAAICRSYLADGYAACGQYDEAISQLSIAPPEDNLAVRGLYAANLAGCHLAMKHIEAAEDAIRELTQIIDACRLSKASLAGNLTEMLTLHKQHLACLQGKAVDTDVLESSFVRAQYHLRRLELAKVLAMTAIRDGNSDAAKKHLSYLRKNGGLTVYKRWADSI